MIISEVMGWRISLQLNYWLMLFMASPYQAVSSPHIFMPCEIFLPANLCGRETPVLPRRPHRIGERRLIDEPLPGNFTEVFIIPLTVLCCAKSLQSCPTPCNPMDCIRQAPLSLGFSRPEYWSGLPCPPPRDLPEPGIKPRSAASPVLAGGFFTISTTARS